jgi:hypothetical protein
LPDFDLVQGTRIPVIADTHGLLRPEALAHLVDSPLILHVGDVDRPAILEELNEIAPTIVVRGNVDRGDFGDALPLTEVVDIGGRLIYMRHIVQDIDIDPAASGVQLVLSGHSHQPGIENRSGVTYLNPGSIGPWRFHLPVSMALLTVTETGFSPELIKLSV